MSFIIHRKPVYRIYVEEQGGSAIAHVAELPGCFALGSSAPKAVQAVPRSIERFLLWLKQHREPLVPEAHVSRPNIADLYVAEVLRDTNPADAYSKPALFEPDTSPLSDEHLTRTLRWLGYSRADLLARIEGLSEEELQARHVTLDRTLLSLLHHIADTEYNIINSLVGPLEEAPQLRQAATEADAAAQTVYGDVRSHLAYTREIFTRYTTQIPADRRSKTVYSTQPPILGERWTLPKALRRALEHELRHWGEA